MIKITFTIKKAKDHELSWQKVYVVLLPTKDCREEMEKTEYNPVPLGLSMYEWREL